MTFKSFGDYYRFINANTDFTGVCVFLLSNGKKRFERNFVNGKYHGKQFGWHNNGKKWFEYNFVDGKQYGKQYCWYSNGQKEYEFNYVNGFHIGMQFFDGVTYEEKPEDRLIWYLIVKEFL